MICLRASPSTYLYFDTLVLQHTEDDNASIHPADGVVDDAEVPVEGIHDSVMWLVTKMTVRLVNLGHQAEEAMHRIGPS